MVAAGIFFLVAGQAPTLSDAPQVEMALAVRQAARPTRTEQMAWERLYFGSAKDPQSIVGREALSKLKDLRTFTLPDGDLEIRFWIGFGITYLRGYAFRLKGGEWKGIALLPAQPDMAEYAKDDYKQPLDAPKLGWKAWWMKLDMLDILTLPDFESLPGKKDAFLDGTSYVVEINRNGSYRTYKYDNPDQQTGKWPELLKFQQIARFIDDQFRK